MERGEWQWREMWKRVEAKQGEVNNFGMSNWLAQGLGQVGAIFMELSKVQ